MALVKCRECKNDVAHDAKACPHCGARKPAESNLQKVIVIAVVLFIFLALANRVEKDPSETTKANDEKSEITEVNDEKIDVTQLAQKGWDFVEEKAEPLKMLVNGNFTMSDYNRIIGIPASKLLGEWPEFSRYSDESYSVCFFYLDTFRIHSEDYFKWKGKAHKDKKIADIYKYHAEELLKRKEGCRRVLDGIKDDWHEYISVDWDQTHPER